MTVASRSSFGAAPFPSPCWKAACCGLPGKDKIARFGFASLAQDGDGAVDNGTRCSRPAFIRRRAPSRFSCQGRFRAIASQDFTGTRGGQDAKFQRQRASASLPQLGNEGSNILIRHRGMMAARQLRRSWQQVVQMAAPSGGVLAITEAFGLGRVQDLFDPSAHPGGGFGLRRPDRLRTARTSSVAMVSTGLRPRAGVGLQGRFPLSLVLLVSEAGRKSFPHVVGHLAKRGNAPVALALINGIKPLGNLPARAAAFSRASARDTGGAPKPHLFGPAAPSEAQNPFAGTGFRNDQIEVAAVAVFARLGGFDFARREFVWPRSAPIRSPTQSPKIARLGASGNRRWRTVANLMPLFSGLSLISPGGRRRTSMAR